MQMSDTIIKVEGLSKKYIISHEGKEYYTAIRDVITRRAKGMLKKKPAQRVTKEEFWALKDVNFEIKKGDAVGIIGRNGAGKSTLLKILSRITEPTQGRIEINGRVASLLEVGTGFHPELTGRENIFLNGAILGMSRVEIKRKFDEIVDFSGVEKFLDTPVKRYSSGMYVRLAFAVAAHLEQEILVVDEVLAVGDAEFQKKCLGKMEQVSKGEGRTVLFVSHNMLAIKSLCNSSILMNKGTIQQIGGIQEVIETYINVNSLNSSALIEKEKDGFIINSIYSSNNGVEGNFNIEDDLVVSLDVSNSIDQQPINVNFFFNTPEGVTIFATCSPSERLDKGKYIYTCTIPANTLNDILYTISIMVISKGPILLHSINEILSIQGHEAKREGDWLGEFPGLIKPLNFIWKKNKMN
jgi:lipopolysaccharide transport system ATP-binding protein